jgi:ABC-type multidrug transport system fused ATPase/permease subunit
MGTKALHFQSKRKLRGGSDLTRLLRPYRTKLWLMVGLSFIGGLSEAAVLVLIVDAAVSLSSHGGGMASVSAGPLHLVHVSLGLILTAALGLSFVRLAAQLGASWFTSSLTAEVQRVVRTSAFDAYIDAAWGVQASEREGNLQQLMSIEVQRASEAILAVGTGLTAACNLVMLLISAVVISPVAAIVMLALVGGLAALSRPVTGRARAMATSRTLEELQMAQSINELVRTAEEIRVHGVAVKEKARLAGESSRVAHWVRRLVFVQLGVSQAYQGAALLVLIAALFAVYEVGASNVAGLGAVVLVLLRSFAYTQQMQTSYHIIVANGPSATRIHEQQSYYLENPTPVGDRPLEQIDSLALESVSYAYRPENRALERVSLAAHSGEVIGVVGPSGSGKSTLVQILLRLRTPVEGHYLINGTDAGEFCQSDWARLVSYVPQEPKLISGTVAENIRFYRQDISDDQVAAAARLANLHHEIIRWPGGYNTVIGQRADAISGGQRQRLCIARALLSSPQLLILDEPTSALDALSEQVVQRTLEGLRGRTTTFIIAHRISTLSLCDRVLVLADGRVEALDTPENLSRQGGFYQQVLEILAQGRIGA